MTPNRILIVEDDQSIRDALDLTFDMLGIRASWASCGSEAVEHIQRLAPQARPTLVVVDGRLPDIHGLELIRDLKTMLSSDTEYYMFTAEAGLKSEELRQYGIAGLIRKPFDTERLIDLAARHSAADSAELSEITDTKKPAPAHSLLVSCVT